jgi:AraC-like DNA-binding protein
VEAGTVPTVIGRPAPLLRGAVSEYIDFDMAGWPPGRHRGLPAGSLTIMLSRGRPVGVAPQGDAGGAIRLAASVSGLITDAVDVLHDGHERGVQVTLTPAGARTLLGVPAGVLAGRTEDLGDILGGPPVAALTEQLACAAGPVERKAVLDRAFSRLLRQDATPSPVARAWAGLVATDGRVPISTLAREVGWSRRHLATQFTAEVGVSPKAAARVLRFERVGRLLRAGRAGGLSELAVRCGYYDQAHLSTEWRSLAGCTLTTWMREELIHLPPLP